MEQTWTMILKFVRVMYVSHEWPSGYSSSSTGVIQNVAKVDIIKVVKDGIDTIGDLKAKTKAGTGCGGCIPLVTNIFNVRKRVTKLRIRGRFYSLIVSLG